MVRSRKKSSTDNDTEVVATPSRRSGRARKTVSYGEEDEIPQALLEGVVEDLSEEEVKPKRGGRRKKSNAGTTTAAKPRGRRASKATVQDPIPEEGAAVPDAEVSSQESATSEPVKTIEEETSSQESQETTNGTSDQAAEVEQQEQKEEEEKKNGEIKSTSEQVDGSTGKPSDHHTEDSKEDKNNCKLEKEKAQEEEEEQTTTKEEEPELPDFEEPEEKKEEPFEMIEKDDIPKEVEKEVESEKEEEKEDEKEEDPDMLQLDANIDEDMELNKAPEIKADDEKKEERKRRWQSDEKEKSPIPERKRRNSVKKTDTRDLSPPPGEPSATVHITNLVRPFTLPQLKDFLAVHGEYSDFWIDKIKSNCFVKYNEVDSAINCRKLIHGKKWPSSNPKTLRVMYSTEVKMQSAKEGTIDTASYKRPENIRREKRRSASRSPVRGMRSENEFVKDSKRREKSPEESAESEEDDDDVGGICLDDLFKKTKTVPSVYWLPLTDEEIKARDDAREERKKAREERRKASEERRTKPRKRSKSKSRSKSRSRSRSNKRSRSRS